MKAATYTLELLTPCFCAGADQAKAEIRAPAIRGQLRWWFRALGGSAADERTIFGGVAGTASSSSLIIRVQALEPAPWSPPPFSPNDHESYVWYYASASGTTVKGAKGPRWSPTGALGSGTTFQLHILQHRSLDSILQTQLDVALKCFLQLGAIGLRATRGLGAFACQKDPFTPAILATLQSKGFVCEYRVAALANTAAIAREIGGLVKGSRKKNQMKSDQASPFGSSTPRQTSAIYFRPVRANSQSKDCNLVVFEAPHSRVLGKESDRSRVVGHNPSRLLKPDPVGHR